jgi:hypothetical protein
MSKAPHVLSVVVAALAAGTAVAQDVRPRAVVELFTSQGCSSCPPADAVLGDLARDPGVVALSFPVDYWDYLGWKDTLSRPGFSQRQKAYAEQRGDRQVYTPQAVVNGVRHALGSDRSAIEAAASSSRDQGALAVPLKVVEEGETIRVDVGAHPGESATLWLMPLTRHAEVKIGRGENRGRSVAYCNVVRSLTKVGEWTGEARSFDVPASAARVAAADGFAVVLQRGSTERPGPILGAAIEPAK